MSATELDDDITSYWAKAGKAAPKLLSSQLDNDLDNYFVGRKPSATEAEAAPTEDA